MIFKSLKLVLSSKLHSEQLGEEQTVNHQVRLIVLPLFTNFRNPDVLYLLFGTSGELTFGTSFLEFLKR